MLSELDNRSLNENQTNNVDTILAKFISVYQKSYSWNHVLIRIIEGSKNTSTKKKCRCRTYGVFKSTQFCTAKHSHYKEVCLRFFKELPCILLSMFEKAKTKSWNK